jgi:DNA repair exonuclease SbcCD ATPase subunit
MKYIVFKRLSIKNFLSVGEDPVIIDFKTGLHIITGINRDKEDRRNGVGKSTVADAIYFAVFGTSLRELKKEHIINNIVRKDCEVVLDFDIQDSSFKNEYQIVRTLEPSKCIVFKNGQDKTRDSIINTNEYIAEKISCSPEIFQNCVIMTANNTIPFMAKKKVEKRKFIEGIFNLEVFSNMLLTLRQEYNDIKKDFEIDSARYIEVENSLKLQQAQKNAYLEEREKKVKKYQDRQNSNAKELEQLTGQLNKFETIDTLKIENDIKLLGKKAEKNDTDIKGVRDAISSIKTTVNHKEDILTKIGTDKSQCPVCLRSITEHDKELIKEEKKKIKEEISSLEKEVKNNITKEKEFNGLDSKIHKAIELLKGKIHDYKIQLKDRESIQSRMNQLNIWQKELEVDLKDLGNTDTNFDKTIDEVANALKELSVKVESSKGNLNMLDTVKFVVSEEGVKSFIVKKILQLFNNKLAYYLKKMDANCVCTFNEYFEEEIYDEKGKLCSYFNFSGAERKNIDLACLFAFMDIRRLQGDVAFNFSIYDELLDSSLDERGVELVLGILRERIEKYNECIMVISHRKESTKFATGDIIYLEKRNGKTKRANFSDA